MTTFTEDIGLFGAPSAGEELVAERVLARPTGAYTEHDIADVIIPSYFRYCVAVMLDPVLVIAQAVHETENFASWWAARPRRNPAGIGVNGEKRAGQPKDPAGWEYDEGAKLWKKGKRFAGWEEEAIPAHVGRLLAYMLPPRTGSMMQRSLIDLALSLHPLDPKVRGSARTLKQLGKAHNPSGLGWASPGKIYGRQIAAAARRLAA